MKFIKLKYHYPFNPKNTMQAQDFTLKELTVNVAHLVSLTNGFLIVAYVIAGYDLDDESIRKVQHFMDQQILEEK